MEETKNFMFNKNPMLVLSYLSKNISKDNIASHISRDLSLAIGSVHGILKEFERACIVKSRRVGKSILYEINKDEPLVKSFRVFDNLIELRPLIEMLKPNTRKIVLFGSCAKGEDNSESDFDLLIVADEAEYATILDSISKYEIDREIKPIILDTFEFMEMESNEPVFYKEVIKGIELWEVSDDK